ncbi:Transglycosylase-like domain-containing protein [Austwickia chelonae]|uniref:Resuscitation-promoting factor core lysozyme-like domain-containing protein n=1 Tax=Austwickia chelonae NBRC 105200 TaxID=1184607 RepID=K6W7P2_9MICO|nr:transglycosylase family protein [Austwickia chelonae]GAB77847.1 hypothetical protein AUCHE_08_00890 [Austwickia chelonae NBRC 105200]SEV90735.1 Transglycosylase-like domain-containing protein [Austwickia chelonae]
MAYTPKHASPRRSVRRTVKVGALGVATATVGVGMAAVPAQAAPAGGNAWDRLAQCEAGGNWHINNGNGYYGGLQFSLRSWQGAGGSAYAARPDLASREAQIAVGQKLLAMQGPGAWPVCSVKAGLTKASGSVGGGAVAKPAALANPAQTAAKPAVATKPAAVAATPKAVAPVKPAHGQLSASDTQMVQQWLGGEATGTWDKAALSALQARLGVSETGKTDAATIAATEKLFGMKASGLDYFTQPMLVSLAAHARAEVAAASLQSLMLAAEGGNISPETVGLNADPVAYS